MSGKQREKDKGKANRREEVGETRRDGECQLPRGHKIQPVFLWREVAELGGQIKEDQSDPWKARHPQHGRATRTTTGRARLRGGFSGPPEPQDPLPEEGRERMDGSRAVSGACVCVCVCLQQTHSQGGSCQQMPLTVLL